MHENPNIRAGQRAGVVHRTGLSGGQGPDDNGAPANADEPCVPSRRRRPKRTERGRRSRADQYRQDPSRHRADARPFVRRHRPAAPAARARGLQPRRGAGGRRPGGADHRRGEDRSAFPALPGMHGRGDAGGDRRGLSRHRRNPARRRSRTRPYLHRPHAPSPRPRGDAAPRRRNDARHRREAPPGRKHRHPAAHVGALLVGIEEDHAPAAALGGRRLLDRRGLCHRRADPPPARRRGGRARLAQPAGAERPGRAVPVGRRRFPGRHRRDRHGPQPRSSTMSPSPPTGSSTASSSAS